MTGTSDIKQGVVRVMAAEGVFLAMQEHITSLPADVLSTPMGQMLAPMLTGEHTR